MKLIKAIGLVMLLSGAVMAGQVTDSVLLTITPSFNLSVNISSTTNDFGSTVGLGESRTICVGDITNDGNVSSVWQKNASTLSGTVGTGKWTLVTTEPGMNQFKLLAISTGVGTAVNLQGAGDNASIAGNQAYIGVTGSMSDLVEGGTVSPTHPKSEMRRLWVSLLMPNNITSGDQQTITLSVQALVR